MGQGTGGCGDPPPEHPRGWLWLSASGTHPGPRTKWRATPARRPPPSSGLPEQLRPIRGPAGGLGEAGGVQSCWEPPRLGQGPPRDPCLGQDHRLEPGGRPPQPGARGSPHPAGLHAVGQHDQGVALLLPHQAPEVAHSLRQGALGRDELPGAPETLVEGGRRVRSPLPPALTFRGSRAQPDPSLTGMKLALMYSEPGCPRRARRGTRDQSSKGRRWS